jgi:GntR family transcriptional regulator
MHCFDVDVRYDRGRGQASNAKRSDDVSKLLKAYDRSRVPLYIQVASVLRTRIQSGQWGAGEKISTLEELEREFEVARVTVRQAVDILREEGMLQARQGLGTFVSKRSQDRHWVQLATNWNSLIESLKDNVPRRLTIERDVARPDLAEGDGKAAANYVKLRSVQYRNDEPYSVVNLHLARDVFDLKPERFKGAAALVTIDAMDEITLMDAHQSLTIRSADPEIADLLRISIGAPTVEAHCVVVDDRGIAIYVGDIIYRSENIKLQINLLATSPVGAKKQRNGFEAIGLPRRKPRKA